MGGQAQVVVGADHKDTTVVDHDFSALRSFQRQEVRIKIVLFGLDGSSN
jgi:hypothetical protein